MMKTISYILPALLAIGAVTATRVSAKGIVDGVRVSEVKLERDGESMSVDMTFGLDSLKVDGNRAILLTPKLINGADSLELPSIGIYGRRRYYYYLRNGETSFKASEKPDSITYSHTITYADWMNGAALTLSRSDYGCCDKLLAWQQGALEIWLKGYASPESPYAHNRELAIGRTEALKNYIRRLYQFEDGIITTDYEPEDWDGLRRYVAQSDIAHRTEILALIDSNLDPDAKEAKIKRTYPEDYKFLLLSCYPALRHTDYRITYSIRTFSDAEEIKRIMAEQPDKLSLNEFYIVAQQYEPGSEEFTEVFDTAVRLFPDDETANLNAANAAIRHDDLAGAERYLAKAGSSAEAIYARGALAIRNKDYETARRYLNEAKGRGLSQAAVTLHELDRGCR